MARLAGISKGSAEADVVLLGRLTNFLTTDTTPSVPVAWTENEGNRRFTAALDTSGVVEEGLPPCSSTRRTRQQHSAGSSLCRIGTGPHSTIEGRQHVRRR